MIPRRVARSSVAAIAGLTIFAAVAGDAAAAGVRSVSPGPLSSAPVSAALERAFEAAVHVPAADVGGIRAGTLHLGSADGRLWASAGFTPARSAARRVRDSFQDGAATGVFVKAGTSWRLVQTGLYGCGYGIPGALKAAWHLAQPAACTESPAEQRAAADRALAALPAPARAAAQTVVAQTASAKTASTATPAAATKTAATGAGAPQASTAASLGQRIAAIALSQVGVSATPAVTNFNGVDCDPYSSLVAGFSANSDGCGYNAKFGLEDENETWCADFNKWVWENAGITADMNTLNAGAVSFYHWAVKQGQNPKLDTGTPQVGDSILFFSPGSFPTIADHVGIVTSVSSSGTIDMVNGDFAAKPDVHVEYDTGITSLSSFAASVWGPGEEWAIVAPPATAAQPTPTGSMSGPSVAVTGTTGSFRAAGAVTGGSVTGYYWTFGDGRTTNASGPDVTHVFSEPGTYTVTVTITSSLGTIVTLRRNVRVLAPSSGVASVPSDGIWYQPLPVLQYLFTRSGGRLAVDSWDGASWLQLRVPGHPSATGNFAALSYPDAANADAMTPHAYYRSARGSLAETYLSKSGWVTRQLPGKPVAGGAIVATTTASGVAVFFVDRAGNLVTSAPGPRGWTSRDLLHVGSTIRPGSLALADTTLGPDVFAVGPAGAIKAFSYRGGRWSGQSIPAKTTRGASLAALTTPDGRVAVAYVNSYRGHLAEAAETGPTTAGRWHITYLPGKPARNKPLAVTNYLLPSMIPATPGSFPQQPGSTVSSSIATPLGTEMFYLTGSGAPAVAFDSGAGWKVAKLPGKASGITAASAYPVEEEPSEEFLSTARGLTQDVTHARSGDPSGTWMARTLPATPSRWADQIVLYAADAADRTAARAAAKAAGLPAKQVSTSFATAWADTLSGHYLVIAVGTPAVAALSFNVCGWSNPSALAAGSTPFFYITGPRKTRPQAGGFVNAASDTAANTKARAADLAYYAMHRKLPARAKSVPAAVRPQHACAGSPS